MIRLAALIFGLGALLSYILFYVLARMGDFYLTICGGWKLFPGWCIIETWVEPLLLVGMACVIMVALWREIWTLLKDYHV